MTDFCPKDSKASFWQKFCCKGNSLNTIYHDVILDYYWVDYACELGCKC